MELIRLLLIVLMVYFLIDYILEKLLWVYKSRAYLLDSIQRYVDKAISESVEDMTKGLNEEEKKKRLENINVNKVKSVLFLEIYRQLKIKNAIIILLNPFSGTIDDIAKNKKLLNFIIE